MARFLHPTFSPKRLHLNLRNHRKLLIVDGQIGFTGGMNIGDRHLIYKKNNKRPVADIHYLVEGPVVGEMQEAFLEDWSFATGDLLENREYPYPKPHPTGQALCKGISSGPNEDFEQLLWLFINALACARKNIRIVTPYFIPDKVMISNLNTASMRGVNVEIILPIKNNLPFVHWASQAYLWELLEHGVKIYYQPPPFTHNKLLLIDEGYALVGSSNLDPRSLRLNFEFDLEIYDQAFVHHMAQYFEKIKSISKPITLEDMDKLPLLMRMRNSFCKLFSPFL